MTPNRQQNYINHVALVLDRSTSMSHHRASVVKVADGLVKQLAKRSTELDQETRVTIYSFGSTVECLVYDKDVLRLPSIASLYSIEGMTALIDATMLSQLDLAMTPEKYGEHAFLTYVITDGQENRSRYHTPRDLHALLSSQRDHWTVAALVPDVAGEQQAKSLGFYAGNIALWDASTVGGFEKAMERVAAATEGFMQGRTTGQRGTKTLFSTSATAVNRKTVAAADLKPLKSDKFLLLKASQDAPIREFVQGEGHEYLIGSSFYQLTKTETIQSQKQVAIRRKKDGKVYTGSGARSIVGLPLDEEVRVKPDYNPEFDVFIQSTSVNRKVKAGTSVLVLQ